MRRFHVVILLILVALCLVAWGVFFVLGQAQSPAMAALPPKPTFCEVIRGYTTVGRSR